jgi:hypothetical protein
MSSTTVWQAFGESPHHYSQYIANTNRILDVEQFPGLEAVSRQKVPHNAIGKDTRAGPLESTFGQEHLALGSGLFFRFGHFDGFP